MRTALQDELDAARQLLLIPTTDFKPLPYTTDWKHLQEKIYQSFCRISGSTRPIWLWDSFKNGYLGLDLNVYIPSILSRLIPVNELIWFMASDGSNFLFYEGKVTAIESVIEATTGVLDEYYLISKRYDWLFCVNHHDLLIGTGEFAIQQLRSLMRDFPELVIAAYPA